MSLAKYIDLLRTRTLYFPKASRFQDETEGKWWGQAHLYENAQRWGQSPANSQILKELLERAGNDESGIVREINKTLHSANDRFEEEVRAILYPKRGLLDPIEDPHPNVTGFFLPINSEGDRRQSLADFIESVYVHPMLDKRSLMVQAVTENQQTIQCR